MIEYKKSNISFAKALRKEMTPWERKLWFSYLRDYPLRIQRQKAIANYIVDFYCAKAKLAIELDGSGHYEQKQQKQDMRRTQDLNALGIEVIRICNSDIDRNLTGVCEFIDRTIGQRLSEKTSGVEWRHIER